VCIIIDLTCVVVVVVFRDRKTPQGLRTRMPLNQKAKQGTWGGGSTALPPRKSVAKRGNFWMKASQSCIDSFCVS
jgi:hypothetical protein